MLMDKTLNQTVSMKTQTQDVTCMYNVHQISDALFFKIKDEDVTQT